MSLDNAKNFAKGTLSAGIDNSVTSMVLTTGHGARFPSVPFNVVIWNKTDYPDPADDPNVEICRVTVVSTDTFTMTRAQEGTSASTHNTGGKTYGIIAPLTAKAINTDVLEVKFAVTQTTHGLSVGDWIKSSGANTYAKAKADSAANAEVVGIVTLVPDANNFTFQTAGIVTTGVPAQAAGTVMYLDPSTAGAMTTTEPSTATQVSKPVLLVLENAAKGEVLNLRGMVRVANPTLTALTGSEIDTATDTVKYATAKAIDDSLLVKTTKSQTLTNKTLTAPVINLPTGTIHVHDQQILSIQIFS